MIKVTSFGFFQEPLRDEYITRLTRAYPSFSWDQIAIKKLPDERPSQLIPEEKKFLEKHTSFVLIDVSGKAMDSKIFSDWLFQGPDRHLVIGPAFGFHSNFLERAQQKIKLSDLTFTHKTAQIMLAETLYRAHCLQINHPFVK